MSRLHSHPRFLKGLAWALSLLTAALFVYFLITYDVLDLLRQLGFRFALALILLATFHVLESVLGTQMILKGLGYAPSYRDLYLTVTASLPASHSTPAKIGLPVRLALFKQYLGIPTTVAVANITLETFLGLGVVGFIVLAGAVLAFDDVVGFLVSDVNYFGVLALFTISFLAAFALFVVGRHFVFVRRFLERTIASAKTVKPFYVFAYVILLLIRIALRAFVTYAVVTRLGYMVAPLAILYVQSISGLLGVISVLPLGLGAKDLSLITLLVAIGVPFDIAIFATSIERVLWTGAPFALGVLSVNRLGLKWAEAVSTLAEDG
ncbi:MAG: flippase-like domain-containing protein [Chloroflexi bacterium]|nr:flippase-like domain-containing protein [Chloroflexota bacterium]